MRTTKHTHTHTHIVYNWRCVKIKPRNLFLCATKTEKRQQKAASHLHVNRV